MELKNKMGPIVVGSVGLITAAIITLSPKIEPVLKQPRFERPAMSGHFVKLTSEILGSKQMEFLHEYLDKKISIEVPFSITRKGFQNSLEIEGWVSGHGPGFVRLNDIHGKKTTLAVSTDHYVEKFTLILDKPLTNPQAMALASRLSKQIHSKGHGFEFTLDVQGNETDLVERITWFRFKSSGY